jgi:hypothetical protein
MSLMQLPWSNCGRAITCVTLLAFSLTISGCVDPGGTSDGSDGFGVLVNTDTSKSTIGGVRLKTGENVYLYGTFNSDGTVGEVTSALFQNADGQQLKLFFESGRPVQAVGFDGSKLDITYSEVSSTRLTGEAVFTPVDGSAPTTFPFDIDLQKTAADLAASVQQLTGMQISADPPPADPASTTSKPAVSQRGVQVLIVPVFISLTGFAVVQVMAQIMSSVSQAVTGVGRAIVFAFMTPFILMGNIMRTALGQPLITVDLSAGIINIPPPPGRG